MSVWPTATQEKTDKQKLDTISLGVYSSLKGDRDMFLFIKSSALLMKSCLSASKTSDLLYSPLDKERQKRVNVSLDFYLANIGLAHTYLREAIDRKSEHLLFVNSKSVFTNCIYSVICLSTQGNWSQAKELLDCHSKEIFKLLGGMLFTSAKTQEQVNIFIKEAKKTANFYTHFLELRLEMEQDLSNKNLQENMQKIQEIKNFFTSIVQTPGVKNQLALIALFYHKDKEAQNLIDSIKPTDDFGRCSFISHKNLNLKLKNESIRRSYLKLLQDKLDDATSRQEVLVRKPSML